LPIALGLQIILLHELREGRNMVWSCNLDEEDESRVDIFDQMQATLAKSQ
jgi:hypothetical protein